MFKLSNLYFLWLDITHIARILHLIKTPVCWLWLLVFKVYCKILGCEIKTNNSSIAKKVLVSFLFIHTVFSSSYDVSTHLWKHIYCQVVPTTNKVKHYDSLEHTKTTKRSRFLSKLSSFRKWLTSFVLIGYRQGNLYNVSCSCFWLTCKQSFTHVTGPSI